MLWWWCTEVGLGSAIESCLWVQACHVCMCESWGMTRTRARPSRVEMLDCLWLWP